MQNPRGRDSTRVGAIVASSRNRDEHVAMVPHLLLSHEDGITSAAVTTTEGKGYDTVRSTL